MRRVLVLDDYQRCAADFGPWSRLADRVAVTFVDRHLNEHELVPVARDAEVIVAIRERTPFPRELLERLPDLRLLVTTAPDNAVIDVAAANEQGIVVCGTRRAGGGVIEHAWGLILALAKNIPREDRAVRSGAWQVSVSTQLAGATLGIVGLGHLGTAMLPIASALEMEVIAWSENLTAERAQSVGVTAVSKAELFRASDVVSVHLRLSERTRSIVGGAEFELMRPTAYLVNTSRGPIIDELALVAAFRAGAIAGAGLDVFSEEPLPLHHPLLELSNVVLTPHTAYVTRQNYAVFFEDVVENIEAYLSGDPMRVITPK